MNAYPRIRATSVFRACERSDGELVLASVLPLHVNFECLCMRVARCSRTNQNQRRNQKCMSAALLYANNAHKAQRNAVREVSVGMVGR